jgi:hypothetical protein
MKSSADQLMQGFYGDDGRFLAHRRLAMALTVLGMTSLAIISLYQVGILKHLPEPPLPGLDAERVNGSAEAYEILNTPDAVLGLGSYAATLGLEALGGADRVRRNPWVPLALAAKCGVDTFQAARLTRKSWIHFRAFSFYSLITVAATFLTLPVVLPETLAAWRKIRSTLL